ncbi:MAG: HDOD domain-containing protein [Gammaproteobacteria bacterium]|nr:HDOD domain-containing protein [Gammaproteobacteria bacterium]MDH3856906.1 HDOD domain-containing protein [Gammaproteobacteria bacterium]
MLEPLLKQAGELPALPEVYIRVTELLETENASGLKIGEAVQTDPALTARVLKMINSAYYGLRNPVTSISQAVTLLGRQQLKQVLLGSVLAGVFKDFDVTHFPLRDFWQHCIKTAIIGRQLAMQNARIIDHDAFFTAGLLHDVGWLVIAKVNPGSYVQITQLAKEENKEVLQVETEKLGVTHIDVGVALLEKWGIPGLITECVRKHHNRDHIGPLSVETSIVSLANQLSRLDLSDGAQEEEQEEEERVSGILSMIPNWENSKCTSEQIGIACRLADQQWLEVMESLGMMDLDIDDSLEETFLFNTDLDRL